MVTCGVKDPGRLKRDGGSTEHGETSIERAQLHHNKNMSTTSVEVMLDQSHEQPKHDLQAEEGEPYARMEVELGSDTSRDRRLAEVIETTNNLPAPISPLPAASQEPTQPVPEVPVPPPAVDEAKVILPDSNFYLRYCPVCMLDQQLRAKHCNYCNLCIATYDHHCPWIGNCVGEKNRLLFLLFLSIQCSELWVCILHILLSTEETRWWEWVFLCILTLTQLFLTLLLCAHTFMLTRNVTTWELLAKTRITYLKNWPNRWVSPFNQGLIANFRMYLAAIPDKAPPIKWQLPENLLLP